MRLGAGADAEEQHADGPDELEAAAPLAPLVEQGEREDEREERGRGWTRTVVGDHAASGAMGSDEAEQESIEQAEASS